MPSIRELKAELRKELNNIDAEMVVLDAQSSFLAGRKSTLLVVLDLCAGDLIIKKADIVKEKKNDRPKEHG